MSKQTPDQEAADFNRRCPVGTHVIALNGIHTTITGVATVIGGRAVCWINGTSWPVSIAHLTKAYGQDE